MLGDSQKLGVFVDFLFCLGGSFKLGCFVGDPLGLVPQWGSSMTPRYGGSVAVQKTDLS